MLFYLKNLNDDNTFYLVDKNQFHVGRKECDFLIQNDQSISRKHAIIRLKVPENKVTVEDCGSKYKTLLKGEPLKPNTESELAVGDNIQFGICNSLYRLQKYEIVTTGTRLNNDIKTKLIKDLSTLNGKYVDQWTPDCTHLTVKEITLTIKFLHALIDEKPVVTPAYWAKFADRIKKNLPPPDVNHYSKPQVAEVLLNKIDLNPNPKRKNLYKGKLFIFPKEKDKKQLEDIIRKTGGTSISWEKNPMPLEDIEKSPKEFLIIQTTETIKEPDLNEVIKVFSKQGKRTIPLQEIAMSIVLCSCERDCNPSFNKIEQVFPLSGPAAPSQHNALVADTQSEYFAIKELKSEEKEVIPDTFETQLGDSQCNFLQPTNEIVKEKQTNSQSTKRLNCDILEENTTKKAKIHNETQVEVKKEKKDKFLCKNTTTPKKRLSEDISCDEQNESKSNITVNPFAHLLNKRSRTGNQNTYKKDESNPFKFTNKFTTTGISKDNPFKLSLGSKKRISEDLSEQSSSKKRRDTVNNSIFSSTRNENVSHNISNPTRVSRIKNSMNNTWMSKNTTNVTANTSDSIENQFDIEIKQFIELFKNTVVVEVMELPQKLEKFRGDLEESPNGKVNFKMFKKVKPLRPQTKIIGKMSFTPMVPGSTTGIEDSRREFHDSDNEVEHVPKVKKNKPKKFII